MSAPDLEALADRRGALAAELDVAERELFDDIVRRVRAGERVNVSDIAKRAALSRQTIYNRLEALGVRAGDLDG